VALWLPEGRRQSLGVALTGAVHRLSTHLAKMKAGDVSESTMHRCMGLLRQLLEERGDRKKYATLAMFCDWLLHPKLDRSKAGGDLLDILDATFARSRTVDQQIQQLLEGLVRRGWANRSCCFWEVLSLIRVFFSMRVDFSRL
jgi:hypothetical protein